MNIQTVNNQNNQQSFGARLSIKSAQRISSKEKQTLVEQAKGILGTDDLIHVQVGKEQTGVLEGENANSWNKVPFYSATATITKNGQASITKSLPQVAYHGEKLPTPTEMIKNFLDSLGAQAAKSGEKADAGFSITA